MVNPSRTKQDVIRQITDKTGIDPLTTRIIREAFYEVVEEALPTGQPIYIPTFGSVSLKRRAAKVAPHISQQTALHLAAHVIPYFKPSAEFAQQVRSQSVPTKSEK